MSPPEFSSIESRHFPCAYHPVIGKVRRYRSLVSRAFAESLRYR